MLALSIVLGLRHGIDLDHVAALADITGGSTRLPEMPQRTTVCLL